MDRRSPGPPARTDDTGPRVEPVPKPGGGIRWLTRLDPAGEAEYRQAVRPLAGRIERALGPEAFAIRTRPSADGPALAPWAPARAAWRKTLRSVLRAAPPGTAFAVADVRDCYGSISPETIASLLGPEAAHAVAFLRRVQRTRRARSSDRSGALRGPGQRRPRSRWIAPSGRTGARHVRWVDDVVLWGARSDVRRALCALDDVTGRMGLSLHEGKTRQAVDIDEARAIALGEQDSSIIAAP